MHITNAVALATIVGLCAMGCANATEDTGAPSEEAVSSTEQAVRTYRFTAFDNPYGDGTPNPAAKVVGMARGYVINNDAAVSGIKEWTVTAMELWNLPPDRTFGAHAHALKCEDTQGGGHYQNVAGSIDPMTSEIWLDFKTDANGHGNILVLSPFAVRPGGVQSFVIHTNPTDPATGKAGAKLACANLTLVK